MEWRTIWPWLFIRFLMTFYSPLFTGLASIRVQEDWEKGTVLQKKIRYWAVCPLSKEYVTGLWRFSSGKRRWSILWVAYCRFFLIMLMHGHSECGYCWTKRRVGVLGAKWRLGDGERWTSRNVFRWATLNSLSRRILLTVLSAGVDNVCILSSYGLPLIGIADRIFYRHIPLRYAPPSRDSEEDSCRIRCSDCPWPPPNVWRSSQSSVFRRGLARINTSPPSESNQYVLIYSWYLTILIAALGPQHMAQQADVYKDMYIPKNTYLFSNLGFMCRDPRIFDNPDIYMPERWLPDHNANTSLLPDVEDIIFGFGRRWFLDFCLTSYTNDRFRVCPGQYLADRAGFVFVAAVLKTFDIVPISGEVIPKEFNYLDAVVRCVELALLRSNF